MTNKAFFMTGLNQLKERSIPVPTPKTNEVLIKLAYVGICGSDVHYLEHGRIGDFVVNGDFILGHECAGTVVSIGSGVQGLQVGDRVALEPGVTCGQCEFCKTGRYNLCPDVEFLATPPYHGCFSNYISFPANMCFKLPEHISCKEGALVEPLAVGLEAAERGHVQLGSSVVILGAGCIGLTTLLACKAQGATQIIVVDIIEKRLQKALELGATEVIHAKQENVIQAVMKLTGEMGADVVFETAGTALTTQQTPFLIKRGGCIVLIGMAPQASYEFDFARLMSNVGRIETIFRYKNMYPVAIRAIASGKINVAGIVTHEFDFSQLVEAFDTNINHKDDTVKVVINMTE